MLWKIQSPPVRKLFLASAVMPFILSYTKQLTAEPTKHIHTHIAGCTLYSVHDIIQIMNREKRKNPCLE